VVETLVGTVAQGKGIQPEEAREEVIGSGLSRRTFRIWAEDNLDALLGVASLQGFLQIRRNRQAAANHQARGQPARAAASLLPPLAPVAVEAAGGLREAGLVGERVGGTLDDFDAIDTNRDGVIDREEWEQAMHAGRLPLHKSEHCLPPTPTPPQQQQRAEEEEGEEVGAATEAAYTMLATPNASILETDLTPLTPTGMPHFLPPAEAPPPPLTPGAGEWRKSTLPGPSPRVHINELSQSHDKFFDDLPPRVRQWAQESRSNHPGALSQSDGPSMPTRTMGAGSSSNFAKSSSNLSVRDRVLDASAAGQASARARQLQQEISRLQADLVANLD